MQRKLRKLHQNINKNVTVEMPTGIGNPNAGATANRGQWCKVQTTVTFMSEVKSEYRNL